MRFQKKEGQFDRIRTTQHQELPMSAAAAEDASVEFSLKEISDRLIDVVGESLGAAPRVIDKGKKERPEPTPEIKRLMSTPPLTPKEIAHINRNCSEPVTHNVVVTIRIDRRFDVHQLAWPLYGQHNLDKFSAPVCIKMKHPHSAALIFSSGECIITGTKSINAAAMAAIQLVKFMSANTGVPVDYSDLRVRNRMATVYLGYTINQPWLLAENPDVGYNEDSFKALKITRAYGTVLLFPTGSFVITGPTTPERAMALRDEIIPFLARYKVLDATRKEQEESKRRVERMATDLKNMERLVKGVEATRRRAHAQKPKMYSRVSEAALPKYRGLIDIQQGYCFAPSAKKPYCQHHIWVRYPGSPESGLPLGKMAMPLIKQLYAQNGFHFPPHRKTIAKGSPAAKKRPRQHDPPAKPIIGWQPPDGLYIMPHHREVLPSAASSTYTIPSVPEKNTPPSAVADDEKEGKPSAKKRARLA